VEAEVGLPTTPLPPAVPGPSPTPPPGDAIPQMASADLLRREDVVGSPVAAMSPSLNEVADIALDDTAPPVDPPTPELPSPGVANDVVSQPLPPVAPADNFSPPALLTGRDPPATQAPVLLTGDPTRAKEVAPIVLAIPQDTAGRDAVDSYDAGVGIPAWLEKLEVGSQPSDSSDNGVLVAPGAAPSAYGSSPLTARPILSLGTS